MVSAQVLDCARPLPVIDLLNLSTKEAEDGDLIHHYVFILDKEEQPVYLEITKVIQSVSYLGNTLNVLAESEHPDFPSILYMYSYETNMLFDVVS